MMLSAEVTIDLDEKRRVWSTSSIEIAELPESDEEKAKLFTNVSMGAATGALQAYENAKVKTEQPSGPRGFKER